MQVSALGGAYKGTLVERTETGVRIRLKGSSEIVFVSYVHLDPKGFKPERIKRARVPKVKAPKPTSTPKAKKTLPKPERVERDTRSDLQRFGKSLGLGIGHYVGSK